MDSKQTDNKQESKAKKAEDNKETKKVESGSEVKKAEVSKDTYVMTVTHLSWGFRNKNHFFADRKPKINAKVMGKFAKILPIWLERGWIKKGSYK